MTIAEAIDTLRVAGAVKCGRDGIRVRLPRRRPEHVERALATVRADTLGALALLASCRPVQDTSDDQPPSDAGAAFEAPAVALYFDDRTRSLRLEKIADVTRNEGRIQMVVSIAEPSVVAEIERQQKRVDERRLTRQNETKSDRWVD